MSVLHTVHYNRCTLYSVQYSSAGFTVGNRLIRLLLQKPAWLCINVYNSCIWFGLVGMSPVTRSDLVWHFRLLWLRTVWFGRFVSSEHIRFWPFLAICELLRFGWYKFPMLLQQVWFGSLVSGLVWPKCQLAWRDDKYCTTGEHAIYPLSNRSGEKN